MAAIRLTRTHRMLVGIVVAGAVIIAGIGFAGSYAAVRTLALHRGFGWFANVFPIGVDAGIVVLLSLDLLLTWLRIPFPLLRQTAWLLTAATIAFNGAAAWPDPLGVGMHAIIPVLFVVCVEAARHAIGRVADITADKHMESVRITRWILAPAPTFRLWRRMKLWELRSYEEVIRREQDRLVYRARLRARYGVAWRRKAPVEALMPLRLARYGVPLAETADAGLQAAGIEVLPLVRQLEAAATTPEPAATAADATAVQDPEQPAAAAAVPAAAAAPGPVPQQPEPQAQPTQQELYEQYAQQQAYERQMYEQGFYGEHDSPWFAAQQYAQYQQQQAQQQAQWNEQARQQGQFAPQQFAQGPGRQDQQPQVMVPSGPEHMRPLGNGGALNGGGGANGQNGFNPSAFNTAGGNAFPGPRQEFRQQPQEQQRYEQPAPAPEFVPEPPQPEPEPAPEAEETYPVGGLEFPDGVPVEDVYLGAYRGYVRENGTMPNARQLARFLPTLYKGEAPEERQLVNAIRDLRYRYSSEANAESIP